MGYSPSFKSRLDAKEVLKAVNRLKTIQESEVKAHLATLPPAWEVNAAVKDAWCSLIVRRAAFVADTIVKPLFDQGEMDI